MELQSHESPFSSAKYEILFQNKEKTKDISEITQTNIFFNINKSLRKTNGNHFSFNTSFSYFLDRTEIAHVKQKFWSSTQKMFLQVDDENIEFLDQMIIHILSIRTGYNSNVD